jgi:hypothetical protein
MHADPTHPAADYYRRLEYVAVPGGAPVAWVPALARLLRQIRDREASQPSRQAAPQRDAAATPDRGAQDHTARAATQRDSP